MKLFEFIKKNKDFVSKYLNQKEINIVLADMLNFLYEKDINFNHDYLSSLLDTLCLESKKDEEIFLLCIKNDLKEFAEKEYKTNSYYEKIKIPSIKLKDYSLGYSCYYPYQLFAYEELSLIKENYYFEKYKVGYFKNKFSFPFLAYKGDIWMCITPNEINTMQPYIESAEGNVLVFGLGLGYFPFMISNKKEVKSITIIEKDSTIINLFNQYIYPYFINKHKIKIIQEDAINYAKKDFKADYCFIDLWHNPNDGLPIYLTLKKFEKSNVKYGYWLEESILCMYRRCMLTIFEEILSGFTEKDYTKSKNDYDAIINNIYSKIVNIEINNKEEFSSFLSNESIKRIIVL